jgi:HD-like signal output (HDOD) protein
MSIALESAFNELPPLPDVALRLIKAVNDSRAGANEIVSILRTDASLTAEVLRRANSPVYGLAARVGSPGQAVMMLGTDEIGRMATSITLARHFGTGHRTIKRLWRHAFARATVAERIAKAAGVASETAYIGGLLADIGIYGLLVSFPDIEQRILETVSDALALLAGEQHEYGLDHCQSGEWLAHRWRLPASIIETVTGHHDEPKAPTLPAVVHWADQVATHLAFGFLGSGQSPADLNAYAELRGSVPVLAQALPQEAEELFDWLVARVPV